MREGRLDLRALAGAGSPDVFVEGHVQRQGSCQCEGPGVVTFEVQRDGLFEVRNRLIERAALRHDRNLETLGRIPSFGTPDRGVDRAARRRGTRRRVLRPPLADDADGLRWRPVANGELINATAQAFEVIPFVRMVLRRVRSIGW